MIKEVIATGKDLEEARANAKQALGVDDLADIKYEILDLGKRGFLGFGASPSKVKAYVELPDEPGTAPRAPRSPKDNDRPPRKNKNNRSGRGNNRREAREETSKVELTEKVVVEYKPEPEINYIERDVEEGIDLSLDFVRAFIKNLGIEAEATLYTGDEGGRKIIISGKDSGMLIGHHGDTLDALQYLTNLASTKKNKNGERNREHVVLDIEGYRAKREETLRALARRMARKALKNNRNVTLEPMSAYERRIIHSEIQGIEGVSTSSIGSDDNRKVVIYVLRPDKKRTQEAPAETGESATENE